jgi:hypothetical protein
MNDFLKKLNVLVKASINDAVSGEHTARPPRADKRLDDDIQELRQRINDAVDYEDQMQTRVRQFEGEAARWDKQADDAVAQGNDTNARYAIEQMKRAEQRAALAQDDLREHQRVTQELIQRVNLLEAVVADARAKQSSERSGAAGADENSPEQTNAPGAQANSPEQPEPLEQSGEPTKAANTPPVYDDAQPIHIRLPDLSNILRDARDKITSLSETAAQRDSLSTDATTADDAPAQQTQQAGGDSAEVDDDLERRRERLTKR